MTRKPTVPIVNNAGVEVTFERQTANNVSRCLITLKPGEIHTERGTHMTYETLVLKDSNGGYTNQIISMDELADSRYEKIEVTRDDRGFNLVKHERIMNMRETSIQRLSGFFQTLFRSRPSGGTLPT